MKKFLEPPIQLKSGRYPPYLDVGDFFRDKPATQIDIPLGKSVSSPLVQQWTVERQESERHLYKQWFCLLQHVSNSHYYNGGYR